MWRNGILKLGIILSILGCDTPSVEVSPAFYHWQTKVSLTATEQAYLDSLQVEKLYMKFFDVDWDFNQQAAFPQAQVQLDTLSWQPRVVVPTVFITNRTFQQISSPSIDSLAINIHHRISKLLEQWPATELREIQIDCDWTQSTREKYFDFLDRFKSLLPVETQLSATIRLHQVKFAKRTGIPPVDRGMLMFYNVGDLEDWNTENSILDLDLAQQYLYNFDGYSLALDLALPLFSWGVLYRQGRMIKLLNQLNKEELTIENSFKEIGQNRYEVVQSTYFKGHYLYQGDWIRIEEIPYSTLKETALILRKVLKKNDLSLSFYHLDTAIIKNYSYEQLESVLQIFEGSNGSE